MRASPWWAPTAAWSAPISVNPADRSADCAERDLGRDDLIDCRRLLSAIPRRIDPLNDGLNDLQFGSLSVNPDSARRELLAGAQDNGTWHGWLERTSRHAWSQVSTGDGGPSAFDAGSPRIGYLTYQNGIPAVNFHSGNPARWIAITYPLESSGEEKAFYTPLIADPVVAGRAFIGFEHVWRTDDHGGNEAALEATCAAEETPGCGDWKPLGPNLTSGAFGNDRAGGDVAAITRTPSDRRTLWASTATGRIFVSKNADASPAAVKFDRIDTPKTPGRFVSGIAVDPDDPNHAFVSYSGYNVYTPGTPGHVFEVRYDPRTGDATFVDVSHNLGDQPVTGVIFDAATGDVYAATDFGVSRLPAGAREWEDAAPGLPAVAVYGLTLDAGGHVLYAATHGRGAYALELPGHPAG